MTKKVILNNSWNSRLAGEFSEPYMINLRSFLQKELDAGKKIFPKKEDVFRALNATPFEKVRVVIIGQDPYHGAGQAHGLSFSVPDGVKPPPSLMNIYKEIAADMAVSIPNSGNLQSWADQGVLLLNAVLSVQAHQAASHRNRGWEKFTDKIIESLNCERHNLVFMLWGSYAQKKGSIVDRKRHLVLEAPHPSPLSAHRGFMGCRHFSKANQYLVEKGLLPIDWTEQLSLIAADNRNGDRLEKN